MKKLLKILVCVSLVFNSAQAQITHNSQGHLDENATAALKKAEKKLQNVSGLVIEKPSKSISKILSGSTADLSLNYTKK